MAKQLLKKFIADKQIDGDKIKLLAGQSIKAESVSGTEVDLLSVDSTGKVFAMGSEVGKKSEITQVSSDLSAEVTRAQTEEASIRTDFAAADASLQTQITDNFNALSNDFADIETALTDEINDRIAADTNLQSQIDALSGSSGTSLAALEASLTQEIADRIADVNAEESRALAAEGVLSAAISQEVSDRQSAVSGVQSQINAIMQGSSSSLDSFIEVVQAFQTADSNLNNAITALSTGLSADIDAEEAARIAADNALDARVDVLEAVVWVKEKFAIVNGQTSVTLSFTPKAGSMSAFVDRLAIHEGASEDYSISGTVMTFLNDLVSPGQSSLGNGDTVYVKYQK
jgi:hypothetical protein